jgi:hypothetical protein
MKQRSRAARWQIQRRTTMRACRLFIGYVLIALVALDEHQIRSDNSALHFDIKRNVRVIGCRAFVACLE